VPFDDSDTVAEDPINRRNRGGLVELNATHRQPPSLVAYAAASSLRMRWGEPDHRSRPWQPAH